MAAWAASRLWRRAFAWRVLVTAASITSVAAIAVHSDIAALMKNGQPSLPVGGAPPPAPNPTGGTPAVGGSTPAGCQQIGTPPPIPSPGNATVFAPPTGYSQETLGRVQDFSSRVQASATVGQLGLRCERIAGAADLLKSEDLAYIRCDSDLADKLSAVRGCDREIADSDVRRASLSAALTTWRADRTATAAIEIAAAGAALDTPFDRSRSASLETEQGLREADEARALLSESDARIKRLAAAAALAPDDTASPEALQALAAAARELSVFDRQRMTQGDRTAADLGAAVAAAIAESNTRFADLDAALALSRASSGDSVSQALIAAVDALTPRDMRWTTPARDAAIAQARAAAAGYALSRLEEAAVTYGAEDADAAEELRRLLNAVEANGGVPAPTEAQTRALDVAGSAAARLAQSDQRLAAARAAAARWRSNPAGELGGDVEAGREALTAFDMQRVTAEDRTAIATLDQALDVLRASAEGKWSWSNRGDVAVHVRTLSGEPELQAAAETLRDELERRGFATAPSPEGSAIDLALRWRGAQEASLSTGGTTVRSVSATVGVEAVWSFTGDAAFAVTETGDQAGGHGPSQREGAARRAAMHIADAIEEHVRTDQP